MNSRLNEILEEIRELEKKVQSEMKRREEELKYRVSEGKDPRSNRVWSPALLFLQAPLLRRTGLW